MIVISDFILLLLSGFWRNSSVFGIEMAHSLAQIGVRFVPIPVETDEEFHTLAASLSQKLEMMVAKAEADERDQV
ncbi:hypothetical protein ECTA8571_35350 [Escherichia coli]|nr:hypothetical protein ECTA8571_35350 [Escherichia coli]